MSIIIKGISRAVITSAVISIFAVLPIQAKGQGNMRKADTNKDRNISMEEFKNFHGSRFNKIDANNDGKVTEEEFNTHLQKRIEKQKKRFFKKHDANKDGKVTKEEFTSRSENRFKMLDTNKDGMIAPEEAKKMHKEKKIHGKKEK